MFRESFRPLTSQNLLSSMERGSMIYVGHPDELRELYDIAVSMGWKNGVDFMTHYKDMSFQRL
jgi:hypothetical protein